MRDIERGSGTRLLKAGLVELCVRVKSDFPILL